VCDGLEMGMRSVAAMVLGLVLVADSAVAYAKTKRPPPQVPAGAADLISKTAAWSAARDFASLRLVMTNDFAWSFGGDDGADGAIAAWQKDPRYLPALTGVLERPCRPADYDGKPGVECPGRGGLSFRAWFVRVQSGWKFAAFVEGD
jgi:hypothetical protein